MSHSITLSGTELPIIIRRHRASRRMVIRYQPLQSCVSLTLPRYVSIRQGLDFVASRHGWIETQVNAHPARAPFVDGAQIPLLGRLYTLRHVGGRGVVTVDGDTLLVHGDSGFMERRVRTWIVTLARAEITARVREKAARLGVEPGKISLRDTTSCWGSCTQNGDLSFSWRLVFAAPEILDYLVSHEVAHLRELNHSKTFWKIVAELCPHWRESRDWLKGRGNELYAWG